MEISGKVVVITGGARGIGAAMATRFAADGAEAVVVADLDEAGARDVATHVEHSGAGSIARRTDVADPADVQALVDATVERFGRVDLFCSNAGIAAGEGLEAPLAVWQRTWDVNVMAHVHAANAVLPRMLERGEGYLLQTVSAAGLLTSPGDAPYTATKHAALALAEWIAVTYGDRGIKVSALCPQGVRTDLLMRGIESETPAALAVAAAGEILEPVQVVDTVMEGLADERFLILPHPEVAEYVKMKAADVDRWIRGVRRLIPG
ncbi:MAG: SDR family oxidoreductase [Motilibacteraceae bacterium]